jgi:hypothetical protein
MEVEYKKIDEYDINHKYKILSIDIGITNLGLSITLWDKSWENFDIIYVNLIDLNILNHDIVSKEDCKLYHTKHIVDKMEHFFQEFNHIMEEVDYITVELQPIMGLKSVEGLIFSRWRHKAILVHPTKMHMFYNIKNFDYEKRKEMTVKISLMNIKRPIVLEAFNYYERRHDMADSICIMKYWCSLQREKYIKEMKEEVTHNLFKQNKNININDFFEKYRYNK